MSLVLSLSGGDRATPPLRLVEGRDFTIGRAAEADLSLPDPTQQVSSRHCAIRHIAGRWMIADTSTNGTTVNGEKVSAPRALAAGDVIRVGAYEIAVSDGSAATPAPAAAAAAPATPAAALVAGVHRLLATRTRQIGELGARLPDTLAKNPLATGDATRAATALAALPPPAAAEAVTAAIDAIDRHNAAALMAMQAALRDTLAKVAPDKAALAEGFTKTFAAEFRAAYESLASKA